MAIAGLRGSGNFEASERPKNFREMILWRDPNGQAPLTALLSKVKKEVTDDPEFNWYEEELNIIRMAVNAVTTTTITTLTFTTGDATNLKAGDLLLIEAITETTTYADEIVQVAVTPSVTNTVSVTRGAAGSTAAATTASSYVTLMGSAYGEGTTSPDATSRNPTKVLNYTQIFKDAYELTGTAENTKLRTGDAVQNDKKRKTFDHATRQEFAYLLGKKSESLTGGTNGKPLRTTGGLLAALAGAAASYSHCMKIWSTAATIDTFMDSVYPIFNFTKGGGAGDERIVFCGNGYVNVLNKLANLSTASSHRISFEGLTKVYGMNLQTWVLPQGTLYLKTHPLMNQHTRLTKSAFFIDPSCIVYRPMKNRDTKSQDNIQANDADSRKGQWLTEAGLEYQQMATMCYHGNIS